MQRTGKLNFDEKSWLKELNVLHIYKHIVTKLTLFLLQKEKK